MIGWITDNLGTASFEEMIEKTNIYVVDVRDMVDKVGNLVNAVKDKIDEALFHLEHGEKVVICCDYGKSRSNAFAVGVLAKALQITFNEALNRVIQATGEKDIKIEVLAAVRKAIEDQKIPYSSTPPLATDKRILLTGGSGFIGKALKSRLSKNYQVFAPNRKEIDLTEGLVELDTFVKEKYISHIIHLANPRIYVTNRAMGDSIIMLRNVLDVCRENNVKLIYTSSWEVYSGYRSRFLLASESLPRLPKGPYGETKYLCEMLIEHYFHLYNHLSYVIVRSSPVYGINSDKPKFIYNFIHKAIRGDDIVVHEYLNGFPALDLLHIADMVEALILTVENDVTGPINIGTENSINTTEIAQLIVNMLGSKSIIKHNKIQDFTSNIVMDTSRAVLELGWHAKTNIKDGLYGIVSKYL